MHVPVGLIMQRGTAISQRELRVVEVARAKARALGRRWMSVVRRMVKVVGVVLKRGMLDDIDVCGKAWQGGLNLNTCR